MYIELQLVAIFVLTSTNRENKEIKTKTIIVTFINLNKAYQKKSRPNEEDKKLLNLMKGYERFKLHFNHWELNLYLTDLV